MGRQPKATFTKGLNQLKNFAASWGENFSLFVLKGETIVAIVWNVGYWDCLKQQSAYNTKHNQKADHSFVITVGLPFDHGIRERGLTALYQHLATPEQLLGRTPNFVGDRESPDASIGAWCKEVE